MSNLIPWFALALWSAAIALRLHPRTRCWAPRGIVGSARTRTNGPVHIAQAGRYLDDPPRVAASSDEYLMPADCPPHSSTSRSAVPWY